MYKGFAIAVVLFALFFSMIAGNLPTSHSNAGQKTAPSAVNVAQVAPVAAPAPQPVQLPPQMAAAPLDSASAPTMLLDNGVPPQAPAPTAQPSPPSNEPPFNPYQADD